MTSKTPLTKNQVRGFWAAWAGWALDGMDSFIYALVMVPALRELLPRSGIPATPEGMEDVSKLPAIRAELKRRGYSEADIRKIMGENFMRVFAEVERVGREMQSR